MLSPEALKLIIGLAVCAVVALIAFLVMFFRSSSGSSSNSSSTVEENSSMPAYEDLPSPSESGEAPAENSAESESSESEEEEEVPDPSDSTIAFKDGENSGTPVTVVPKTYYLRLKDTYSTNGKDKVDVYYYDPVTKKKTKLQTITVSGRKMGAIVIGGLKTFDILLSKDVEPSITNVSLYLQKGGSNTMIPFVHIVEKEGSTDKKVSENFAPILYNSKKKYVKGLFWSKETYTFKPKA
jgi:hypothetical protein